MAKYVTHKLHGRGYNTGTVPGGDPNLNAMLGRSICGLTIPVMIELKDGSWSVVPWVCDGITTRWRRVNCQTCRGIAIERGTLVARA